MIQGSFPRQIAVLHISSRGYGNSMNSRQGRRSTPRLYILDICKTQFTEFSLTYFPWQNKLNREAKQVKSRSKSSYFARQNNLFWKTALRGEKRSSTETEYQ